LFNFKLVLSCIMAYLFFAQAKKSNSLATASETKAGPEILPLPFTPDCIHISEKSGSLLLICHEKHALNLHKPMILRKNMGIPQAKAHRMAEGRRCGDSGVVEPHHIATRPRAPVAAQFPPTLAAAVSGDPGLMFGLTMAAVAAVETFAIDACARADAQRIAQHALADAVTAGEAIAGALGGIAQWMDLRLQGVVARFGAAARRQERDTHAEGVEFVDEAVDHVIDIVVERIIETLECVVHIVSAIAWARVRSDTDSTTADDGPLSPDRARVGGRDDMRDRLSAGSIGASAPRV
jgi:hypothetical protein